MDYSLFNDWLIKAVNIYNITLLLIGNAMFLYLNIVEIIFNYLGFIILPNKHYWPKNLNRLLENMFKIELPIFINYSDNEEFMYYLSNIRYRKKPSIWVILLGNNRPVGGIKINWDRQQPSLRKPGFDSWCIKNNILKDKKGLICNIIQPKFSYPYYSPYTTHHEILYLSSYYLLAHYMVCGNSNPVKVI